jgi:putative hydrolase of the HAD superfamily
MEERRTEPETTWMIGNSPKSDIYPALEAGLGAVYVPHPRTWHLEQAPLPNGHKRFRVVENFADLKRYF